ncbi:MAG: 16S rRNA (cytidine(1402)-2'-O)-methyltransferase [Brumimicrobium sp.]
MSKLYVVPTPIGNMEDITLRALRILKDVEYVLAEDTRTTGNLLKHYDISQPLKSYHIHNEHKALDSIVELIETSDSVALVSDAGTPAISDPGFLLIRECIRRDIEVICLPGASAIIPAIVGSGFPVDSFVFEGFLPHKKGRQTKWKAIAEEKRTVVLYESPHRLPKALKEIEEFVGKERRICVAREISKIHETYHRGTVSELIQYFNENKPLGEIVIVIEAMK